MNDPYHQFRERIDQVSDERDHFREQAAKGPGLRNEIYRLRKMLALARLRIRELQARR